LEDRLDGQETVDRPLNGLADFHHNDRFGVGSPSGWQRIPHSLSAGSPMLRGAPKCDAVIVGSGRVGRRPRSRLCANAAAESSFRRRSGRDREEIGRRSGGDRERSETPGTFRGGQTLGQAGNRRWGRSRPSRRGHGAGSSSRDTPPGSSAAPPGEPCGSPTARRDRPERGFSTTSPGPVAGPVP